MEGCPITRSRGRPKKLPIKKELGTNGFSIDMIHNTMMLFDPCSQPHLVRKRKKDWLFVVFVRNKRKGKMYKKQR